MAARGDLLSVLQRSARDRTLLASCEPEVQELMHQIDVLISGRQREWEGQLVALRSQQQQRERELSSLRVQLQERTAELEQLRKQSVSSESLHKARCSDYEEQVLKLRAELGRLSHNYEQMKTKRSQSVMKHHTSTKQTLQSLTVENKRLRQEVQTLRGRCVEREDGRREAEKQLRLVKMEVSALQEKSLALEGELKFSHSQLDYQKSLVSSGEEGHLAKAKQLSAQVAHLQEVLNTKEAAIRSLQCARDSSEQQAMSAAGESHSVQSQLSQARQLMKNLEVKNLDLKQKLRRREEQLESVEGELRGTAQSVQLLQETVQSKDTLIRSLTEQQQSLQTSRLVELQADLVQAEGRVKGHIDQEKRLREGMARLRQECEECRRECAQWKSKCSTQAKEFAQEKLNLTLKHGNETQQLQGRLSSQEEAISLMSDGCPQELCRCQAELRERNTQLELLGQTARRLEEETRTAEEERDTNRAELEVAIKQVESLTAENKLLRNSISTVSAHSPAHSLTKIPSRHTGPSADSNTLHPSLSLSLPSGSVSKSVTKHATSPAPLQRQRGCRGRAAHASSLSPAKSTPLKPDNAGKSLRATPSQGPGAAKMNLSRTLDTILDRHFEHLDHSLLRVVTGEEEEEEA